MANILFEELGGKYERKGDYLVPCIALPAEEEQPIGTLICPLSSRQDKYLKFSADDACILFGSAGIFLCTPFLFIFHDSFIFRNRIFYGRITCQRFLSYF